MGNAEIKDVNLELLIATMNRSSLHFLADLFPFSDYRNFNILIVNQTTEANLLHSDIENIKVVNSFEKGLSKSRNLAILKATGDVCLFVDDDVKFKSNFDYLILEAHLQDMQAAIITFKMENFDGELFKAYPKVLKHDLNSIQSVNSVVISFKREKILSSNLFFDINFGLGSIFETADEYIFMRDALKLNLKPRFKPELILSHPVFSSGQLDATDKNIFGVSALFCKYYRVFSYFKLIHHLYLLFHQNKINTSQIFRKFKVGLSGIKKYKSLKK